MITSCMGKDAFLCKQSVLKKRLVGENQNPYVSETNMGRITK